MTLTPRIAVLLLAGAIGAFGQPAATLGPTDWRSPHRDALEAHRGTPVTPALIGDGTRPTVPLRPASKTAATRPVVFGFLPFWVDQMYYHQIDWELLSHLAVFSVEVSPDGRIANDRGWPWTALVDTAHAHGVRVILTATLFGDSDVASLIRDEENTQRFFEAIRDEMRRGNADGLTIDFEGPGANGWPSQIADFMARLTDYLHREIPGSEISFAAPPVDWGGRWDMEAIAASCDYLFIMGYAWTGSWSGASGPNAPLTGPGRTLTTTVTDDRDFGAVTRSHPEKLILGVPYYGCSWRTSDGAARAPTRTFLDYPEFWESMYGVESHGALWDDVSSTPWYRYQRSGSWYQVWHEDATSLGLKFDLALEHGLRGVGMWALGYESRRPETWQAIEAHLGRRSPPMTAVTDAGDARPRDVALLPAYPNPFNAATRLRAERPGTGRAELTIYDVRGSRVRRWSQEGGAGTASWDWDGRDDDGGAVASGVYVARLRFVGAGETRHASQRLLLLR
jgi:spore germination protein YaaH